MWGFTCFSLPKLCPIYCHTETEILAVSCWITVLKLTEDWHFNKSYLEDDGKLYWLIRLWWHPSGSPQGSMCPKSMQWIWEREWDKPASPELWMEGKGGGVDQDSWEKHSTHSDTHTQRQWCEAKRVVRAVVGEWSCSPVSRFGADVFGDYCWRGENSESIRQPPSLTLYPSSTSMRPRCDESEYSLWCIIITAQFFFFICCICFLIKSL